MGPTERQPEQQPTGQGVAEAYRKAGPYLDASWQLAGAVGLWTGVGYLVDERFGTRPWGIIGGAVLGMGLGFYLFFRAMLALGKKKPER